MKKLYTVIIFTIAISVFTASFLIGRATTLKKIRSEKHNINSGAVVIPREEESVGASKKQDKVPADIPLPETQPIEINLPDRMIFPCGEEVQKDYSQFAVYSETMGDWRAHTGIDYAADVGTEVLCIWGGTVNNVYKDKLWGNCVEILHPNNLRSLYKNLSEDICVKRGETAVEGQVIGYVGKSAAIEGMEHPHLHFEMWQDDVTINPSSYVY